MCAEALTQAEIDALLRGEAPPAPAMITPEEEDTIKQFSEIVVGAGKDTLSALMGEDVTLQMGEISETDPTSIGSAVQGAVVTAELNYKGMIQGKSVVIMPVDIALRIATQMTGGGADSEFGDLEESAFSEAVQSLYSSANTQLAAKVGGEITLDTPDVVARPPSLGEILPPSSERLLLVKYEIKSGAVSGPMYQILPRNLVHSIATASSAGAKTGKKEVEERRSYGSSAKTPQVMTAPALFAPTAGLAAPTMTGPMAPPVDITNLELILDISLEIKCELGRTHRKIKEVLELGPGSVVELDRMAGEPVDILVNDKLFAKGEVVVIDENFGVRITDILSIQERIEALK